MDAPFWNQRYSGSDFVYGMAPNAFVEQNASFIPPGAVLCLAEGEGRNAVHLAGLGYSVTAMDQSTVGMQKAAAQAKAFGLCLSTVVSDLNEYTIASGAWSGIISTFVHLPRELRARVHASVVRGLKPGGVFILEAYTPAQFTKDTGGPKNLDILMSLEDLRKELEGLELLVAWEIDREVIEGSGHTGLASVVQILGRKP